MQDFILRTFSGKHPPPWLGWALLLAVLALTLVAAKHVSVADLAAR
jgi:hypothetical protein